MTDSDIPAPVFKYSTFGNRMLSSTLDLGFIMFFIIPIVDWVSAKIYNPIDLQVFVTTVNSMNLPFDNEHAVNSLLTVAHSPAFWHMVAAQHIIDRMLFNNLMQAGFVALYILPFWFRFSSTPGKMLFRLQIRDMKTGLPMTRKQAVGRFFAYFVSVLPVSQGVLWMIFNKKRRAWHDYLAGTVVVVKPKESLG